MVRQQEEKLNQKIAAAKGGPVRRSVGFTRKVSRQNIIASEFANRLVC